MDSVSRNSNFKFEAHERPHLRITQFKISFYIFLYFHIFYCSFADNF